MSVVVHPSLKIDSKRKGGAPRKTIGAVSFLAYAASDESKRAKYLVTNAHVIARPSFEPEIGDVVICAKTKAHIAELVGWTPLDRRFILKSDIAIAKLMDGVNTNNILPELGPITGTSNHVGAGQVIYTYGPVTKAARDARVISKNLEQVATIELTSDPRDRFDIANVFACEDYAQFGDSGAPLLNRWGRLVGVHVAELADKHLSLALKLNDVLRTASALAAEEIGVCTDPSNKTDLEAIDKVRRVSGRFLSAMERQLP